MTVQAHQQELHPTETPPMSSAIAQHVQPHMRVLPKILALLLTFRDTPSRISLMKGSGFAKETLRCRWRKGLRARSVGEAAGVELSSVAMRLLPRRLPELGVLAARDCKLNLGEESDGRRRD